jgi:PAS domain-containing protein
MEYDGGPEETLDLTREDHRWEALGAVKRGEAVRVLSAILGEVCYWVPDKEIAERIKRAPDYQGEVVYTSAELQELAGQSPELLRGIHQFKKAFGATLEKENPSVNASSVNTVRCGDCQHFQRIDHPHTGRCAQGHGRYWLWDTDKRQCEDFEAAVEGDSERDKAAVIEDLIDRLTESERRSEASEQSWFAVLQKLEMAKAELGEVRERIEFLDQVNVKLLEYSRELRMQGLELEDSLAMEKAYNRMWMLQAHNPASGLSKPDIRLLLQLCHPDKHNGSAASEKATQLLLGLREQTPKMIRP